MDLTIKFDNAEARRQFAVWLCEQGEQDYWDWMDVQEQRADGPITAVEFDYHPQDGRPKNRSTFIADGVIYTRCGRLGA